VNGRSFYGQLVVLLLLTTLIFSCGDKKEPGHIIVSPGKLDFGSSASTLEFDISSSVDDVSWTFAWSLAGDSSWISVSEKNGLATRIPHQIIISVDRQTIPSGQHDGKLIITYQDGELIVPLSLFVVNNVPDVAIRSPKNNTQYSVGQIITFSGVASDPEDGALDSGKFIWRSDKDGNLGEGNDFTRTLGEGRHLISLSVEDVNGAIETTSITLSVIGGKADAQGENNQTADLHAPLNTTGRDFIDGGAQKTRSRTVTLNISAQDETGVVAYFVNDSDVKENEFTQQKNKNSWVWVNINPLVRYKAIVTHLVDNDYPQGARMYINVWFRNAKGVISQSAQDSIVLSEITGQGNDLRAQSADGSVALPNNESFSSRHQAGEVVSMFTPASVPPSAPVSPSVPAVGSGSLSQSGKDDNEDDRGRERKDDNTFYSYGFENGYNGWWVDNGLWEIGLPAEGKPGACFLSSSCAGTVLAGPYSDYIASRLISPVISLPDVETNQRIMLSFIHWYSLHVNDLAKLQIAVETSPENWGKWKTLLVQSGYSRKWNPALVDLSKYAGETVRLGFYLYQPPDAAGVKEGWYIDDFSIALVR
jgi:hypothetical protein